MMTHLRMVALLAVVTAVSAGRTEAFLLDFSGVSDGPMPANSNVEGFGSELQTTRSVRNEVAAGFGLTGSGRGIELQSLISAGSENDGASDSEFVLSPLAGETLDATNRFVGFRFQVDITNGISSLGSIRENPGNGGDDYARISLNADGTMAAGANNVVTIGNYNANQWYHAVYDIDFPGGTTDVYLDGANVATVNHDAIHADANSIAFFAFRGLDATCSCPKDPRGAPQVRIDAIATGASMADVAIPEPASLSLLAVSGLLMLSRRSRRA